MAFTYAGVEYASSEAFNKANLPPSFGGILNTKEQLAMPPNRLVADDEAENRMVLIGGGVLLLGVLFFVLK